MLTVGGFALTGVGVMFAVRRDVSILATKLKPIESAVIKITDLLEATARHDERLRSVERRMDREDAREDHGHSRPR